MRTWSEEAKSDDEGADSEDHLHDELADPLRQTAMHADKTAIKNVTTAKSAGLAIPQTAMHRTTQKYAMSQTSLKFRLSHGTQDDYAARTRRTQKPNSTIELVDCFKPALA